MIDVSKVYQIIWGNISKLKYDVVDYIPYDSISYPYVQVGGLYTNDDNTKNTEGLSCELYINVYSAYKGRKEILEIINKVNESMNKSMSNDEYSIFVRQGRHSDIQDVDRDKNNYYHAVLIYEINIEKKGMI